MALQPIFADQIAFIIFIGASLGYHVFYLFVTRHQPSWSVRARMHLHRRHWIEAIQKRGERIMAVQALRNLIMTNTFLASTMLLLLAFIANFVVANPVVPFGQHEPSWLHGATPVQVKGLILLILYAFAFTMFLTSLRSLNHLSILVGVEADQLQVTEERDPTLFLTSKLNQVESMTTYGRRAVYFSLPVLAWFHSPWFFAVTTLAIFFFFVISMDFVRPLAFRKEMKQARGTSTPTELRGTSPK